MPKCYIFVSHKTKQPSKFRIINVVEIDKEASRTHNIIIQMKFKVAMLKSCSFG